MAFTAGVGWRRQGWTNENNVVAKHLSKLWILFQPILFGLIGTEIDVRKPDLEIRVQLRVHDSLSFYSRWALLMEAPWVWAWWFW